MTVKIINLKVVNGLLRVKEGEIETPTTYFMEVENDDCDRFSIPINADTHMSLTNLYADQATLKREE